MGLKYFARTAGASAIAVMALAGSALADGYGGGSVKDAAPAEEGRKFSYSVNAALTTDYIFRGLSQSSESPAISAGLDVTYGLFYAGFWGSSINFDPDVGESAELDVYAGIKPVWGPVTFDFAVLGYLYPDANDGPSVNELDYLELKAGASITPFTNATLAVNTYWSPDFSGGAVEDAFAVEGSAGYTFSAIGRFTPSVSGAVGYQTGDLDAAAVVGADDDYVYWNVGVGVGFDKFTLDVRYWDTDVSDSGAGSAWALETNADERVVGTIKVVLP
jgi:uncharacterized protein (TIGR02001 family)